MARCVITVVSECRTTITSLSVRAGDETGLGPNTMMGRNMYIRGSDAPDASCESRTEHGMGPDLGNQIPVIRWCERAWGDPPGSSTLNVNALTHLLCMNCMFLLSKP